jgi:hypothetical protein
MGGRGWGDGGAAASDIRPILDLKPPLTAKQVLEVRRLLNDAKAETIWQTEKAISDVMPRYYINQFFRGLISLICLFVLGLKLLGS